MVAATQTYPVGTIAKLLVLSERQVQSLATQGGLPKAERGRYELVPVVQAYVQYLRDRTLAGGEAGGLDVAALKARVLQARARKAETEIDLMSGIALDRGMVATVWGQIVARMRARLLVIPSKCALEVQGARSAGEIAAILSSAVNEALEEISTIPVYTGDNGSDGRAAVAGGGGVEGGASASAADGLTVG